MVVPPSDCCAGQEDNRGCSLAPQLFMVDFGMARIRRCCEDDVQWRKAGREEDEEGAIGYALKKLLGGWFTFIRTLRYYVEGGGPEYEEMWD